MTVPATALEHRPPAGHAGIRIRTRTVFLLVAGVLGLGLGVSYGLVYENAGSPAAPSCPPGSLCAIPPSPPEPPACKGDDCTSDGRRGSTSTTRPPRACRDGCRAPTVPNEPRTGAGVWRSRDLGFSFEADAGDSPSQEDGRSVTYQWNSVSGKLHAELHIEADPATETTPKGLLHRRRTTMADTILGLTEDTDPETMLDGPSIGFVPGVGGSYRGTLVSGSLDPDAPVVVAIFAASDRRITVVFSYAVTGYSNAADVLHVRRWADGILSSFEWRT